MTENEIMQRKVLNSVEDKEELLNELTKPTPEEEAAIRSLLENMSS